MVRNVQSAFDCCERLGRSKNAYERIRRVLKLLHSHKFTTRERRKLFLNLFNKVSQKPSRRKNWQNAKIKCVISCCLFFIFRYLTDSFLLWFKFQLETYSETTLTLPSHFNQRYDVLKMYKEVYSSHHGTNDSIFNKSSSHNDSIQRLPGDSFWNLRLCPSIKPNASLK